MIVSHRVNIVKTTQTTKPKLPKSPKLPKLPQLPTPPTLPKPEQQGVEGGRQGEEVLPGQARCLLLPLLDRQHLVLEHKVNSQQQKKIQMQNFG